MTSVADSRIQQELDSPYALSEERIRFFRENGFIKLKRVFSPAFFRHYEPIIKEWVFKLTRENRPLAERDFYSRAFLQVMNIWEKSDEIKALTFSKRLARISAELMGTTGVKLYHDQALYKEPGGGFTPLHTDYYYMPVDNINVVTIWIPLQETPVDMGAMAFVPKTHLMPELRQYTVSEQSEDSLQKILLQDKKMPLVAEPFEIGEISVHYGSTAHRTEANTSGKPRSVMCVLHVDENARHSKEPYGEHQKKYWNLENQVPGEPFFGVKHPVLYSTK
jgi:Phytanoyl-CoA dioxygenase (PhyH)